MATDYTSVAHDTEAPDNDLIDDVCQTYGVTWDMLYAHAAFRRTEANKEKHKHWKPPKGSTLPASDIRSMMADKTDININRAKYSIKKANSAAQNTLVSLTIQMPQILILLMTCVRPTELLWICFMPMLPPGVLMPIRRSISIGSPQ